MLKFSGNSGGGNDPCPEAQQHRALTVRTFTAGGELQVVIIHLTTSKVMKIDFFRHSCLLFVSDDSIGPVMGRNVPHMVELFKVFQPNLFPGS